jgi:SAM-dependent methyltransferase
MTNSKNWQVSPDLAAKYSSPLDRQLYCDQPLIRLLDVQPNETVLDIGCGNGGFTVQLTEIAHKVVGIDSSVEMLQEANKLTSDIDNISFQEGDAEQLPFENTSFDKVLACMVINTLNNPASVKNVFSEAYRVLKPGGKFVIAMAHPMTLDQKTKYRWTDWAEGQSQHSLTPGEKITRGFLGKDNAILSVPNYYWPPDYLTNLSMLVGFDTFEIQEPTATLEDLEKHPQLDKALAGVPFFLLISFGKNKF